LPTWWTFVGRSPMKIDRVSVWAGRPWKYARMNMCGQVARENRPMWVWGQVAHENRPCECVGQSPLKIDQCECVGWLSLKIDHDEHVWAGRPWK
jgi:hypothetical protein